MFIVLGSPVTEVGRDHDYDWAVVEPSSMRSLIQLAGRVRRHRAGACVEPNIAVLDTNLRHLQAPGGAAFRWPGFEDGETFSLASHRLGACCARTKSTASTPSTHARASKAPHPRRCSRSAIGWTWSTPACARPCCAPHRQRRPAHHTTAPRCVAPHASQPLRPCSTLPPGGTRRRKTRC